MTEPATAPAAAVVTPKIHIQKRGARIEVLLDRPQALNAFDDDMRRTLADSMTEIARDPDTYIVCLQSTSPKAFCAGGDVRALIEIARSDPARARAYFAGEYALNWTLDCFSKPSVSFINGLCMGSGVGLTAFNTHRIAGEGYQFAMPETAIGLFPDVGAAHVLARLPWPMGLYLGLTGTRVERGDAHWLGLATHCIAVEHQTEIMNRLSDADPVDPLLDTAHEPPPAGPLQHAWPAIERYFLAASLEEIIAALARGAEAGDAFAVSTLAKLQGFSPISLKITDRHIRDAVHTSLRETLIRDYRLACACLQATDFAEGVRAALIDKDREPKWQYASVRDVPADLVARYFAPPPEGDLTLPTREEMQRSRI